MRVLLSTYESHGDVEPKVGLVVQLGALGAEIPVCAPPDFAELLAGVGVPLVPVRRPVRPLVTGATPPSAADLPRRGRVGRRAVRHGPRGGRGMWRAGGDRRDAGRSVAMTEHAVVIAGAGPTGLMLAGELALAGVDLAIVERRASQDLVGSRSGSIP